MAKRYRGFSVTKVKNMFFRRLLILALLPVTLIFLLFTVVGETLINALLATLAQILDGLDHFIEGCQIIAKAAGKSWRIEK